MAETVMAPERSRSGTLGYAMRVYLRKFAGRRGNGSTDLPGLVAHARLDRRTKNLTRRLQPGDIAIIDHADLDRVSAEPLLNPQVSAVVTAAPTISVRSPNPAPQLLAQTPSPLLS